MTRRATIRLDKLGNDAHRDSPAEGKGTPNYLAGLAVSKDGSRLLVASNKANTDKGLLTGPDLDQDNTVRNLLTLVDTATREVVDSIDLDNSDSAGAVAFSPLDDYFFVTLRGNDDLMIFDRIEVERSVGLGGFVTRQRVGSVPSSLAFDAVTERLFVKNDLDRDLTVFDLAGFFASGRADFPRQEIATTATEVLTEEVLRGKRIFHHAGDPRMSGEGYLSCATCHADGGHDGRTWDFTGRGEGLRNTTSLNGRAGMRQGRVHWTANFDEIQDFENDIRTAFGGTGFLTDSQFAATSDPLGPTKEGLDPDLDALAAYVGSLGHDRLPKSPLRRPDGSLTTAALAGEALFTREGCTTCHAGNEMTDGLLHDVGTTGTTSGSRRGDLLPGIETPTLRGLWESAPYLHDGGAPDLAAVFSATGETRIPGETASFSGGGEITTEWTYYNNDETVRDEAFAQVWDQGKLIFAGIDGDTGGTGAIAIRYSSGYAPGTLRVRVNGVDHSAAITPTGNVPDWRYVNWSFVRVENVRLNPGETNTVEISAITPEWLPFAVDEIHVSTPEKLAAAAPHRRVLQLSASECSQLFAFLLELDGSPLSGESSSPPAAPGDLRLTSDEGSGTILLQWSGSPGTLSYRILRGDSSDFSSAGEIGTTTQRRYSDSGAPSGNSLYYWVLAVNEHGASEAGIPVSFSPAEVPPQPDLLIGPRLSLLNGGDDYGQGQVTKRTLSWRRGAKDWILVENDGTDVPLRVSATRGGSACRLAFFQRRGGNVTSLMLTGRLLLDAPLLPSGSQFEIRSRHTGSGIRQVTAFSAFADAKPDRRDRVCLKLRVR